MQLLSISFADKIPVTKVKIRREKINLMELGNIIIEKISESKDTFIKMFFADLRISGDQESFKASMCYLTFLKDISLLKFLKPFSLLLILFIDKIPIIKVQIMQQKNFAYGVNFPI